MRNVMKLNIINRISWWIAISVWGFVLFERDLVGVINFIINVNEMYENNVRNNELSLPSRNVIWRFSIFVKVIKEELL